MIISNSQINNISNIVDRWFNAIIFKISGREFLKESEIKDLIDSGIIPKNYKTISHIEEMYRIGLLRNVPGGIYSKSNLNRFRALQSIKYYPTTDKEKLAIDYVKKSMFLQLNKFKEIVKTNIITSTLKTNNNAISKVINNSIKKIVIDAISKRKAISELAKNLRDYTGDINRDWNRLASSEMCDAFNNGSADAIALRNDGKSDKNIYVFKIVSKDAALCQYCSKLFLFKNGEPIVYTLDELRNNGDNYNRKASEYKAVIGKVHPRCRCSLVEISPGWGFKKGTQIVTFISKDYDVLKDQKNNKKNKKRRNDVKKEKRGGSSK